MGLRDRIKEKLSRDKHTKGNDGKPQDGPATSAAPSGPVLVSPGTSFSRTPPQAPVAVVERISPALASQSTLAAISSPQQPSSLPAATSAIELSVPNEQALVPELVSGISQAQNNDSLWEKAYSKLDLSLRDEYEAVVDNVTKDEGGKLSTDARDGIQTSIQAMADRGKERRESQRVKFTVAKKTLVLGEMLTSVVKCIKTAKPIIDEATKASSAASIAWVGVSLMLPLLTRPSEADAKNLEHISNISSTMGFYTSIEEHLVSKEPGKRVSNLKQIRDKVEDLYAAILEYLCQSVLRFYKSRLKRIGGDLWQSEDWEKLYQKITEADSQLRETTTFMSMLIGNDERNASLGLATSLHNASLDLLAIARKQLQLAEENERAAASKENLEILHELYVADPDAEMQLLENRKDKILDEAFDWILETKEYKALVSWEEEEQCRMLWVRGPAGTGKTMLVMGIVKQLSRPSSQNQGDPDAHHFFCQGTNALFRTKASVIKSLMWQLLKNQSRLISHLKAKFEHTPKPWFAAAEESYSRFLMLCDAFKAMLQDPDLKPCFFVVDALDECDQSIEMMAQITAFAAATDRVKWLISSRPEVVCDEEDADVARFRVEIDSQVLEAPVRKYIEHKLSCLSSTYGPDKLGEISAEITTKAQNTFLWVWFVFQELNSKHKNGRRRVHGDLLSVVRQFPAGLEAAYKRIMDSIDDDDDSVHVDQCKHCLDAVYLAERPITTREMAAILFISNEEMEDVILSCGSLLSIAQSSSIISFIHQSAKDYLARNRFDEESEGKWTHADMFLQSLKAMSAPRPGYTALYANLHGLDHFGPVPKPVLLECQRQEPVVSLQYAVSHWASHYENIDLKQNAAFSGAQRDEVASVFLRNHLLNWMEAFVFSDMGKSGFVSGLDDFLSKYEAFLTGDPKEFGFYDYTTKAPLQGHLLNALFYTPERYAGRFGDLPVAAILRGNTLYQHLKISIEVCGKSRRAENTLRICWPRNQWHAHYREDNTLDIQDLETGDFTKSFQLDWLEVELFSALMETIESEDSEIDESIESDDDDDDRGYLSPESVFLSQGQWFAASCSNTTVKVWNLGEKQCLGEYRLEIDGGNSIIAALSSDGMSIAWLEDYEECPTIQYQESGELNSTIIDSLQTDEDAIEIAISPDKKWVAIASYEEVWVYNLDTLSMDQHVYISGDNLDRLSFSDDGKAFAVRFIDGSVDTYCIDNGGQQQATALWRFSPSSPEVEVPKRTPVFTYERVYDESEDYEFENYESDAEWVTIHDEPFVVLPLSGCIWLSKVGNIISIDSKHSVVTITCECPSCLDTFG